MFEEPEESPSERSVSPADRARDKSDEFRMHAEIAAVFEATRKFDAQLVVGLEPEVARNVQLTMGRLAKARAADSPVLPATAGAEAAGLLGLALERGLGTGDYHLHRRPGEVVIVRWIEGEQVEAFYERLQAHFDAAIEHCWEEERQAKGWKQDAATLAYLDALDAVEVKMAERYLREPIRKHALYVLSTQSADELNIDYLCDYIMGVSAAQVVGEESAPPDGPSEQDLAWFFRLFSLRGVNEGVERMCFFAYLQKTGEDSW